MLPVEHHESVQLALQGTAAYAYVDRILELTRPAVTFYAYPQSQVKGVVSRLGGVPDAPNDWVWPTGPDGPLKFLAQFQLSELCDLPAASILPTSGLLAFFFGPELYGPSNKNDYQIARVYHFDGSALALALPPTNVYLQPAFGLEPTEFWDFPIDRDHFATESFYLGIPADERETVACNLVGVQDASGALKLLGFPSREQRGILQLECEAFAQGFDFRTMSAVEEQLRHNAHEWEILAPFYLAYKEIWPDGNDGYLHFWIRKGDLAAADFSKICYTWERS
jgi:hypothetical protein